MAPNLIVATKRLFAPHKWFAAPPQIKDERRSEHWDTPVPGTYEYIPGRGWSLIAIDKPAANLVKPIPVKYSRVLKRQLLIDEYNDRKCMSEIESADGKIIEIGFFRLDNGLSWVNYLDGDGHFIEGPYKLWCVDQKSGKFRAMLKGDCPEWRSKQASRAASVVSSSSCSVCRTASMDERMHSGVPNSAGLPMSPFGQGSAQQSRTNSIKDFSRSTTRSNSIFDPSPRGSSRVLSNSETVHTAPTSPGDSIRDPSELTAKLEAVQVVQPAN